MSENMANTNENLEELSGRYLLFFISDTLYGVTLSDVLEIINIQSITYIPNTAQYVKGIVNLRGKIVPVIDARLKLGLPEREYDDKTCIIILEIGEARIGLIVDSVSEVVAIDSATLSTPPASGDDATRYLSSISNFGDKVALNIDFRRFFADDLASSSV